MLQLVKKLDFHFNCDAGGTTISAGNSVEVGDDSNYTVWDGEKWTNEYRLDENSIAEIAGIELLTPQHAVGVRDKLEYIRLRIDGEEYKHINFNEHMCPSFSAHDPNQSPFFGGSIRVGDSFENLPLSFCHNIGVPMLLGGQYTDAVPKVGPGDTINVEVRSPRTAEGGADITKDFVVRLSVVECRSIEMFKKLGEMYGWLAGNSISQNFTLRDLEEIGDVDKFDVSKSVDMVDTTNSDSLEYWTALFGGLDVRKPYIFPYIRYANNAAATVTNEEYIFTKVGSKVLHDEQELSWSFDKRKALRLDHIGVTPHADQKYTRMFAQGRAANPYAWTPEDIENEYPMPVGLKYDDINYHGPASIGRGATIWNTKGHISIKDNGTSIPAWADGVRGGSVSVWGKKYEF